MKKLRSLLVKGLDRTRSLWPDIRRSFRWVHAAARILKNTAGRAADDVKTRYTRLLDDWRDQGIGRQLMQAGATHLLAKGCRSAFLWVLRDNPNRWFYERLGGRPAAQSVTRVAGTDLQQVAYACDPIERLLAASPTRS